MIQEYVNKLIENLPDHIKKSKKPIVIDLVLDGGFFNGSYLVGALYFLKEMEKRNYIKIDRISGCSIGSIVGLLYLNDLLDEISKLYKLSIESFKKNHQLEIVKNIKTHLEPHITSDMYKKVNQKLYINYNNVVKMKRYVKNKYKNNDKLFDTITKSCFAPYLVDGNVIYKNKYVDGISPYIFKKEEGKKILYLELFSRDKIAHMISIKNEKTNFHRVLTGLLDIHNFFIKETNTPMCSYVNDWNYITNCRQEIKLFLEKIILYIIYTLSIIKNYIPEDFKNTVFYKLIYKICYEVFIVLLETYCF
jgi:hypothetical protein